MSKVSTIYDKIIGVRLSCIILSLLIISIIYFGIEYYNGKLENHSTALYGGLIASLIAVTVQISWNGMSIEKSKNSKKWAY